MFKRIFVFFMFMIAFTAGYLGTEVFFRVKKIPLPFEWFGVLVGLGLASFCMAVFKLVQIHTVSLSDRQETLRAMGRRKRTDLTEILK